MNIDRLNETVDEILSEKSDEELEETLLRMTRKVPKDKREKFLKLLGEAFDQERSRAPVTPTLEEQIDRTYATLIDIETGDIYLVDETDDWDTDEFSKTLAFDPFDIDKIYRDTFELIDELYCLGEYFECYTLGKTLIGTKVAIRDLFYSEFFPIKTFYRKLWIEESLLDELLIQTASAAYHTVTEEERPEAIYSLVEAAESESFTLEDLREYDYDLKDFDQFLDSLIEFLKEKDTPTSSMLHEEAVELTQAK